MAFSGAKGLRDVLPAICALVWSASGCARKEDERRPDIPVPPAAATLADAAGEETPRVRARLIGEEELASLVEKVLAEAEANAHRECKRPLLRGEPLPGAADDDLLALLADPGPAAECRAAVRANKSRLHDLSRYVGDSLPDGWRARYVPYARPAGRPPGDSATVLAQVETACAGVPELLRRAVGHEDACNPYLPGRRALGRILGYVDFARGLGLLARKWMREGRLEEAARLLMDGLRLSQDLGRGGVWLGPMIAVVVAQVLAPDVELLFNLPERFPEGLAESLQSELTALLASEPHPSVYFADDCLESELQDVLPPLMPAGWTPPGGWGERGGPPEAAPGATTGKGMDPRDEVALLLLTVQGIRDRFLSACPPGSAREGCMTGVAAVAEAAPDMADLRRPALQLLEDALRPGANGEALRGQVRAMLIEASIGIGLPMFAKFPPQTQTRVFLLAGFRLLAAFRRVTDATGRCPRLADFDEQPLLSARGDAPVGRLLDVQVDEPSRTYIVTTESELWKSKTDADPTESRPFLMLRCAGARELPVLPISEPVGDEAEPAVPVPAPVPQPST